MKKEQNLQNPQNKVLNTSVVCDRFSVEISEIIALRERMKEINSNDLSNIDFISDNGEIVKINDEIISEFKYTGLSNVDFIVSDYYKNGFEFTDNYQKA